MTRRIQSSTMSLLPEELVRQIHAAPGQVVLVLNGGSRAVAELLEVPGGSKILLEAAVPYSEGALPAWLGSRPEQFCSSRTARAMAVVAFGLARFATGRRNNRLPACPAPPDWRPIGRNEVPIAPTSPCRPPARRGTGRWSWKKTPAAARKRNKSSAAWCSTPWPRPAALTQRLELPLLEQERVEIGAGHRAAAVAGSVPGPRRGH